MVKEELVNKWFEKAKNDIEEADFLLDNNRSLDTVAFHIQQSAEKYLKGFLIYHGWKLEKIHDLIKLLGEVEKINKSFKIFNKPLQKIKNFYIESRYPLGYDVEYTKEELQEAIEDVKSLIEMIKKKVNI